MDIPSEPLFRDSIEVWPRAFHNVISRTLSNAAGCRTSGARSLWLARGDANNPVSALELIRSSRPLVGLNEPQHTALMETFPLIQPSAV
jgi:hypothetical protein